MRKLFFTIFLVQLLISLAFSQDQPINPCSAPEANQFDFWIGEWDLSWDSR